jgi:L-cysteine S-thiosulfotransferase
MRMNVLKPVVILLILWAPHLGFAEAEGPGNEQIGFALMFDQRAGNCIACHSIPNAKGQKAGVQSSFAPPLDGVGKRYERALLTQWVRDARKLNAQTLMPPFGVEWNSATAQGRLLTDAQIADVVAALQTLR